MDAKQPNVPDSNGPLSRRDFLRWARIGGLAAVSLPLWLNLWSRSAMGVVTIEGIDAETVKPSQSPSPGEIVMDPLAPSPQVYGLDLGGGPPLEVFGFEGGEPVGRSSLGQPGADGRVLKRIEGVQYRDLVFYYLLTPRAPINGWLANSLKGTTQPISGSIIVTDRFSGQASTVQFSGGFLRQIDFPEVDTELAQQSAPFRITIGVQRTERGQGIYPFNKFVRIPATSAPMKGWFKLQIDGLGSIQNVVQVETPIFSVGLLPPNPTVGGFPGTKPKNYSNLKLQLPEVNAEPFYDWHTNFVLKGSNAEKFEKRGTLHWLSPTQNNKTVFTLHFENLGILSVVRLPNKPGYVQVEMYCEKVVPEFL